MSDRKKNIAVVLLTGMLMIGLFLISIVKPSEEVSVSERRPLKQYPKLQKESVLSGVFMREFEEYASDQFPFREKFRRLYADISTEILRKKDMDGLYLREDMAIAKEYPLNEASLDHTVDVFQRIYETNLKGKSRDIYLSIIPDKNYFLQDDTSVLSMDYDYFFQKMKEGLPYMKYIDCAPFLTLDDYYKTDPHWRQEKIEDVAIFLADAMGTTVGTPCDRIPVQEYFRGTYAGQAARPLPSEKMYYLTNSVIQKCRVYDKENERQIGMYDEKKAKGRDPYECYLSGPLSYITIENPTAKSEKELIIFRDSFASAIAPLLAEGYSKITLLDIRYLPSYSLQSLVDFEEKDILFLYSTSVLNHSETLK